MPNKIYPVDIGSSLQVETPSLGRMGAMGGSGGRGLNTNPLISLQAKLMEKEYDAKMKLILDRDATINDILNPTKGANDVASFYKIKAPINPYQEKILRGGLQEIHGIAQDYAKLGVKDLNTYATNDFRSKVDRIINREDIRGALREAGELEAFGKANANKQFHPVLKSAVVDIAHSEDGNTAEAWKKIQNSNQYELIPEENDKDVDNIAKFVTEKVVPREDLGLIDIESKYVPAAIKDYYKQKYRRNMVNDYEAGWAYTGDGKPIDKSLTVDQYIDQRSSEYATKYAGVVNHSLQANPEYSHRKKVEEENLRYVHNKALSDEKSARTKGMTDAQLDMAKERSERIKSKNSDLKDKDKDIEIATKKVIKKEGETDADYEDRVVKEIRKVEIPISTQEASDIYNQIDKDLKSASQKTDGGFDKDYKIQVVGSGDSFWLKADETLPEDIYDVANPITGGRQDRRHILQDITGEVMKGGKKYATGTLITSDKNRFDQIPDYYKSVSTGKSNVLTEEEKKKLEDQGYELEANVDYYKVPVEIELDNKDSTYTGERTLLAKTIADLESQDSNIPNGDGSNAYGHYQFMPGTFKELVKRNWDKLTDDEKRVIGTISDQKSYAAAMDQLSGLQHKLVREDWDNELKQRVAEIRKSGEGKDLTDLELAYIAHHQGSSDAAIKYLKSPQSKSIEDKEGLVNRLAKVKEKIAKNPLLKESLDKLTELNETGVAFGFKSNESEKTVSSKPDYTEPVVEPKQDTSPGKAQKASPKKETAKKVARPKIKFE